MKRKKLTWINGSGDGWTWDARGINIIYEIRFKDGKFFWGDAEYGLIGSEPTLEGAMNAAQANHDDAIEDWEAAL